MDCCVVYRAAQSRYIMQENQNELKCAAFVWNYGRFFKLTWIFIWDKITFCLIFIYFWGKNIFKGMKC